LTEWSLEPAVLAEQRLVNLGGFDRCQAAGGNSRILVSRIPATRLTLVPGLGHRAIWEAPGESVELIRDFLGSSTSQA
jgi:pimeloyl-ACP methyl ester carboxylesterase